MRRRGFRSGHAASASTLRAGRCGENLLTVFVEQPWLSAEKPLQQLNCLLLRLYELRVPVMVTPGVHLKRNLPHTEVYLEHNR